MPLAEFVLGALALAARILNLCWRIYTHTVELDISAVSLLKHLILKSVWKIAIVMTAETGTSKVPMSINESTGQVLIVINPEGHNLFSEYFGCFRVSFTSSLGSSVTRCDYLTLQRRNLNLE